MKKAKPEQAREREITIDFNQFFKKKWHYFVVLIFGLLISVGIWAHFGQVMMGDDYPFHVERLQSASRAWSNGQIVPQVDSDALGGFGYAYNLFYGPLVTYLAAGLQALIGAWPIVISLILILCVVGSGLLMCRTMTKISGKPGLGMLVAVLYMTSPYFLNNLYSRMALGEVVAMIAPPILLLGLYQLTVHDKHAARSIAVAAALLLLSHSLSALMFGLFAALYVIFNWTRTVNWPNIWRIIIGAVMALGLSAFFILPLIEAKLVGIYGVFDRGYSEVFFGANPQSVNDHRLWLQQLFVNNGGGSESNIALGVMAVIGILGFWFVYKQIENKDERRFARTLYWLAILAILAALPIIDWHYLPSMAWQIQFPWRLLSVASVALSVVAGYTIFGLVHGLVEAKQNLVAVTAGVVALYLALPMAMPSADHYLNDINVVKDDPVSVGWEAEYAPMALLCSADVEADVAEGYDCSLARIREKLAERGMQVRVTAGMAALGDVVKDGLKMEFTINNLDDAEAMVELPLIYYPGYIATLNGENLRVTHSAEYGLVTVAVPGRANGKVKVSYGLSLWTQVGTIISLTTLGVGIVWCLGSAIYDRKTHKKELPAREMVADDAGDETEMNLDADREEILAGMNEEVVLPEGAEAELTEALEEAAEAERKPRKMARQKAAEKEIAEAVAAEIAKSEEKPEKPKRGRKKAVRTEPAIEKVETETKTTVRTARESVEASKQTVEPAPRRRTTTTRVRMVKNDTPEEE